MSTTTHTGAGVHGALILLSILADTRTWVCKWCHAETTTLSELCSQCRREDCSQGE